MGCLKNTARLQRMKKTQSKIKPIKTGKDIRPTYCLGCKDFRPQGVKMTNKVLREKSNCFVCRSSNSGFLKQKHKNKKKFSHITRHAYLL